MLLDRNIIIYMSSNENQKSEVDAQQRDRKHDRFFMHRRYKCVRACICICVYICMWIRAYVA